MLDEAFDTFEELYFQWRVPIHMIPLTFLHPVEEQVKDSEEWPDEGIVAQSGPQREYESDEEIEKIPVVSTAESSKCTKSSVEMLMLSFLVNYTNIKQSWNGETPLVGVSNVKFRLLHAHRFSTTGSSCTLTLLSTPRLEYL